MEEIGFLGLVEAGQRIRRRDISARELTEAMLARIQALDPRLHAYALPTPEQALAQADAADRDLAAGRWHGPLHGVPVAVKDLCDTRGIVTRAGMPIRAANVPDQDATVVARLAAAGAVLLGKLQMTEGAFSAHHPQVTVPLNPWHPDAWTGVSSSGSGVATAAGLCFGSLGSDTLGSIRFPCTMNGITGLKPTWGRVSRAGVFPLAPSMDHVGPMTRSALDAAAMLGAIAGADPADPTAARRPVPDYLAGLAGGARGLRIGLDRGQLDALADADVLATIDSASRVLTGLGAQIIDIRLPDLLPMARDALQLCVAETAVTHAATWPARRAAYGPVLSGLIEAGQRVGAAELLGIGYRRAAFAGRIDDCLAQVDLLLLPAMNRAAPTLADLASQTTDLAARHARLAFTAPFDMSRHPSLTLPGGFTASGLPVGFQLLGAAFDEVRVLAAGHAFQQVTDWHQRHPLF
ncbi:MAG: amidase [Burkholderiaceae bacterium]